ncbi:MAG: amidohydrolase family protein [Acidobacteriota bacterium]|nr:amidohydrolase family protein [Acidobacteriota bacterium]MDQ2843019.1 amidohydrolase family protein [Acidobacteriota bacterium]
MAETTWGDLPVNDAHVHFFSRSFYAKLASAKKTESVDDLRGLLGWDIPAAEDLGLADKWVAELDANGVGRACLIGSSHGEENAVAAAVKAHPSRFYGFFMLDPLQTDAMDRLSAAVRNPYLDCVCFFPAMHTYSIADPRLVPMLEMISDHHLAAFVHCGALSVGVRKKLALPSQFDMRFSDPLYLHPVALHFPKIRFIVPHFGAGLFREALMLGDLCPNVYLDTSSTNRWMQYEGLDLRTVFRRAIDVLGVERILFGSDSSFFPRGWHRAVFDTQAKALYELGLDAKQAELILRLNREQILEPRRSFSRSA